MSLGRQFYLWSLFWANKRDIVNTYFKRICHLPKNSLEFTYMYVIIELGKTESTVPLFRFIVDSIVPQTLTVFIPSLIPTKVLVTSPITGLINYHLVMRLLWPYPNKLLGARLMVNRDRQAPTHHFISVL